MTLDINDLRVFVMANDRDHTVFVQHMPSRAYVVTETKLRGTKEDESIRMKNRNAAFAKLEKTLRDLNV